MPGTDGNLTSFLVTGEWRHVVEDTMADPDALPDKAAPTGHVVFTPVAPHVTPAGAPARAYTLSTQKALIAGGELRDIQGREGIWLPGDIGGVTVRWRAVTHLEYQGQPIDYPELVFDLTDDVRLTGLIASDVPGQPPYIVDPRIEGLIQDAQVVLSEAQDALEVVEDRVEGLEGAEATAVQAASEAEGYRDEARQARDAAEGHRNTAAGHASDTEGYRDDAAESAQAAEAARAAAEGHESAAEGHESAAGVEADRAGDERSVAADAASQAVAQADRSRDEADRSEAAALVAEGYRWVPRGQWQAGDYVTGDMVVHEDRAYYASEATSVEPPAQPWIPLIPAPQSGVSHWDDLLGIPDVFPPSAHTHDAADISGEATPLLDVNAATVTVAGDGQSVDVSVQDLGAVVMGNAAALEDTAPAVHTHTVADVGGLQEALDERPTHTEMQDAIGQAGGSWDEIDVPLTDIGTGQVGGTVTISRRGHTVTVSSLELQAGASESELAVYELPEWAAPAHVIWRRPLGIFTLGVAHFPGDVPPVQMSLWADSGSSPVDIPIDLVYFTD